jgi:AcrR family transcriptional regulator
VRRQICTYSEKGLAELEKPDDRRSSMLDNLANFVLTEGLSAASLRPLAKAAGTSDRMLLYYFSDKAEIVTATVGRISERLACVLADSIGEPLPLDRLRRKLFELLSAENLWPYMRLWLEIASLSAKGDPFYRAVGEQIARGFLAWGAAQLDSVSPEAREADAARLLVAIEGMMLLKSVGLDDVCEKAVDG